MKKLTVVFPIYKEGERFFVLMGKQAVGKRMPGVRNGFGGKCEEGETVEECAVREVEEEIGLKLQREDLKYVGEIVEGEGGEKHVYLYTTLLNSKINIPDNTEMVDCRWFDIEHTDAYIHEMLPGNDILMPELIASLKDPKEYKTFEIDMSANSALTHATRNVYS
jgi:8-oxo-dGTP diphosphatase